MRCRRFCSCEPTSGESEPCRFFESMIEKRRNNQASLYRLSFAEKAEVEIEYAYLSSEANVYR